MSIFELLFGFQGRINRAQWWLGQVAAIGLGGIFYTILTGWMTTYGLTSDVMQSASPDTQIKFLSSILMVGMLISSTLVWMLFSLAIKRVHDRDHSGVWALAFGLPILFAIVLPNIATMAFAGLTMLWYFFELGALGGSPRVNSYGPPTTAETDEHHIDPLELSVEENIERNLAAGRKQRQAPAAGDEADLEVGDWPSGGRAATFGRRVSA